MYEKVINKVAELYGIAVESMAEKMNSALGGEYIVSLLQKVVGLPISKVAEVEKLLGLEQEKQWQQMLDPVLVRSETAMPVVLPLRLASVDEKSYRWELTEESGEVHGGNFSQSELQCQECFEGDQHQYGLFDLELKIVLPWGYHRFAVYGEQSSDNGPAAEQLLIVTPAKCYVPAGISGDKRIWGPSAHLHAIRSRKNWGIGDFSDLMEILSRGAQLGAGMVHTSPLHCCLPDLSLVNPYSPSCRSLLNILFIDVEAVPEFLECDDCYEIVHEAKFQANLTMSRDSQQVDYQAVYKIKNELFGRLWNYFSANHLNPETSRGADFRRFQEQGGKILYYYGLFVSLYEKFSLDSPGQGGLHDWPQEYQDFESEAVGNFAAQMHDEIEYQQYLQWQAEKQLAGLGRRSMELGLKVGLVGEFPFGAAINGFESWYYKGLFVDSLVAEREPPDDPGNDSAVGLPLVLPNNLKNHRFRPLIEGLQQSMHYTGALVIQSIANYFQTFFSFSGPSREFKASVFFPFDDMLGIIALESQRNRCLVIADNSSLLPAAEREELQQRNIFTSELFLQGGNKREVWPQVGDYSPNVLIRSSAPFLAAAKGFWKGTDIAIKSAEHLFVRETEKEKAIIARASDRAHFLITLEHEGLLPENYTVDPATVAAMDHDLISALYIFLARTSAKILLVSINDLADLAEQAVPPALFGQQFWKMGYPFNIEEILSCQENVAIFQALSRERGVGSIRPSALAVERKIRQEQRVAQSFYRLQLHKNFNFEQAAAIVPYLSRLGISHCYVSPFLTARPGSSHCYDIIDHSTINPEIGSREEFENFLAVLEQHGMALILDVVPNHMGIGSDNHWWMDVLENGEASKYARFFDINWQPQQLDLVGKVLVPFLGDYYGKVIESGQLTLCFNDSSGSFFITYYEHRFPISPRTYPLVLGHDLPRLEAKTGKDHQGFQEFQGLIHSFANLPDRSERSVEMIQIRHRNKEVNKRMLARLCRENPEIRQFVEENTIVINGISGKAESFDLLHHLLEDQPYRLAYWRVAADEINYRRFFDINDLAGLRMEDAEVFQETHKLILDMVATGKLDGLRIDHPDGLYDPQQYFSRLQNAAAGEINNEQLPTQQNPAGQDDLLLYVVAEKILADFEDIPENWPINGTTGYDFSNMLNGLLVDSAAQKKMTAIYHKFIGSKIDFDDLLYDSKRLIIRSSMAGELNVLAILLYRLAQANRYTRDYTFNNLRDGLIEIVCSFPVYRTYIASREIAARDARIIQGAVEKAKVRQKINDGSVLDFIKAVLLLENLGHEKQQAEGLHFVMKFQQYTGPVMAKGFEDTSFYIYNRLLSLNEVGGDPKRFGITMAEFHQSNLDRFRRWPQSMLNTSTHDSKRSEDLRARINVLSELTNEWQKRVRFWSRQNRVLKTRIDDNLVPSLNDEYAFYQNLLGAWPLCSEGEDSPAEFVNRLKSTMLKISREAKVNTSWIKQNGPYEEALISFVEKVLNEQNSGFLHDFIAFQQVISWFGMFNSISQVFIKLLAPGIPDIYQGNEIWRFCLVDPDNRRPVDFNKRQELLFSMLAKIDSEEGGLKTLQQELLANLPDGRAKMYVIAQTLRVRNAWADVFTEGVYLPLEVTGAKSNHLCAFARKLNKRVVLAVAPRLYATLMQSEQTMPFGHQVWEDTEVKLPAGFGECQFENIFSGGAEESAGLQNSPAQFAVGRLLQFWPVALLKGTIPLT